MLALAAPLFGGFVGPPIPLSTPVPDAAPGDRGGARVASNGSEFLVVWSDMGAVHAARVDADGIVRDREPLVIAAGGGSVDVASDGRDYVIACSCGVEPNRAVCLAHVDAETGAVSARGAIRGAHEPALASNGRGYLLAYRLLHNSWVEAVSLRADGSIDGSPYLVARSEFRPKLASNGEHYFAVAGTFTSCEGVLLSETGYAGERQRFGAGALTSWYHVTSDGDTFLVTWGERSGTRGTELHAASVSSRGVIESRKTIHSPAGQHSVAWNGSRYILAYTPIDPSDPFALEIADVFALELDASGDAVSEVIALAAGSGRESSNAMASNGRTTLVTWTNDWRGGAEIEARLHTDDGFGPTFIVSYGVPHQESVAATRNGTRTIVAWAETHGPRLTRKVYVQRLDADATPLDGRGLPVGDSPRHQLRPALAGSVIAWVETEELWEFGATAHVWAAFLDSSGRPTGTPFRIGETTPDARVAVADPGGPLQFILWPSKERRLMATRVVPFAGVLEPPLLVADGSFVTDPRVVSNGAGFLAAWNDGHLMVAAFTAAGQPLGRPTRLDYDTGRALVWNGAEYVLFWTRSSVDGSFAQRVSAFGVPIGAPQPIGDFIVDAAAWTGEEYRVAFHRDRRGSPLSIARISRDLTSVATVPTLARPTPGEDVVLLDDLLIHLVPHRGTDLGHTRVVARRIGENAAPPRRRPTDK